jgi:hypothetical protein
MLDAISKMSSIPETGSLGIGIFAVADTILMLDVRYWMMKIYPLRKGHAGRRIRPLAEIKGVV